MNLGANPVDREGHEAHVERGVEALDGLHEADVPLLDQVTDRQSVPGVAARDVHHEAQVREHELTRRGEVSGLAEALAERALLFAREHGDVAHALEVRIETPERTGQSLVGKMRN